MEDDAVVRDKVAAELDFDPAVRASRIAVGVSRGIVTLFGCTPSYADKVAAIRAAHRVDGVRSVTVDMAVRLPDEGRADQGIAENAVTALNGRSCPGAVRVTVENNWITVHGCAESDRARRDIEATMRKLPGVTGVTNDLHLACDQRVVDIRDRLIAGLRRKPELRDTRISVEVSGGAVTLSGHVPTQMLAKTAETAAWAVPGVTEVHNQLQAP